MTISKILRIHGKVQGVYFRESLRAEASRLGVTGWVRNRKDGTVEAFVQGEDTSLSEIVAWCHRGPPAARVDRVEEEIVAKENGLQEFLRKETE